MELRTTSLLSEMKADQLKPIALDCFSGCGGMTEGLEQAGYRVVGAIELDPFAVRVYKSNHRRVRIWQEDIRELRSQTLMRALKLRKGDLDLLGGCPPCQGFSTLRTRNGKHDISDQRNDLIFEFERLVVDLFPKHVMLENVPRLVDDERFDRFRQTLRNLNYQLKADVLDAADYGVPQRRKRAVVIASRVGEPIFATNHDERSTVRQAIGSLEPAGSSGDPIHDMPEKRSPLVLKRIQNIPKDGGGRESLPHHLALRCHAESDGFGDVYGRMAWDQPAPTITTGCFNPSKGRFLHPEENRAITIREAALLQSFPMSYRFPAKFGKVRLAEMIGNALPPAFVRHHAQELKRLNDD